MRSARRQTRRTERIHIERHRNQRIPHHEGLHAEAAAFRAAEAVHHRIQVGGVPRSHPGSGRILRGQEADGRATQGRVRRALRDRVSAERVSGAARHSDREGAEGGAGIHEGVQEARGNAEGERD